MSTTIPCRESVGLVLGLMFRAQAGSFSALQRSSDGLHKVADTGKSFKQRNKHPCQQIYLQPCKEFVGVGFGRDYGDSCIVAAVHIYMHIYIYLYIYIVCVRICLFEYTCVSVSLYIYTYTYYIYTLVCIHPVSSLVGVGRIRRPDPRAVAMQ